MRQRRWDRSVEDYEYFGPEQIRDDPDHATDPTAYAEKLRQENDAVLDKPTWRKYPYAAPSKQEVKPRAKIVFPDDLPPGELPAEYIWPERPAEPERVSRETRRSKPKPKRKQERPLKKEPKESKQPKAGRDIAPVPRLYFDPITSPSRVMDRWSDQALSAVWRHSRDHSQIRDMPGAYHLQLRRNQATVTDPRQLSTEDRECCFRIVEHTSYQAYKASSIGWHVEGKQYEMKSEKMTYLFVRDPNGNNDSWEDAGLHTDIVAFISFRIEHDDEPHEEREVLYIYEVHIAEKFRGKGLGRWLVFTAEAMAQSISISKTMLTVFTSNKGAVKAYEKMGYTVDQASPPDREVRNRIIKSDYLIMSKLWSLENGQILE